jgi:hypothetical protein
LNRSLLPEPKRLLPRLNQIAGDPKCVWTSPAIKARSRRERFLL